MMATVPATVPASFQSCLKRLKHEQTLHPHLRLSSLEYIPDSNTVQWILSIPGPPTSPYTGKTYDLVIWYESSYPFSAPLLRFQTPIFHPNVTPTGRMSNLLTGVWSPFHSIQTIYDNAIQIMKSPIKEYPYNDAAAAMWGTEAFQTRVNITS